MSFSFSGAGPKADVVRQIRSHHAYDTDQQAVAVRDFIAQLVDEHGEAPTYNGAGQYVYTVSASGHAGHGSPLSLSLTITPAYVPPLDEPAADVAPSQASAELAGQHAIGDYI